MIYELREYTIYPGRIIPWKQNFANRVMPAFEKYGIKMVGCWEVAAGPNHAGAGEGGGIVYLLAFPDMAAWQASWRDLRAELAAGRREREASGLPIEHNVWRIDSKILYPTDFSPMQ